MPYRRGAGLPAVFVVTLMSVCFMLAAVPGAAPAIAQRQTCSAFATQADAQRAYRAYPVGLANLDAYHDGIACESNPGPCVATPAAVASPTPVSIAPPPATPAHPAAPPSAGIVAPPAESAPEAATDHPEDGISRYLLESGEQRLYVGDCSGALLPEDSGALCSTFVARRDDSDGMEAFMVGPVGGDPEMWLFLRRDADGWHVAAWAAYAGEDLPPWDTAVSV
jgi:hypothetical protein